MKRYHLQPLAACIILLALLSGCASGGYIRNRGRDAADIFTATVGIGAGAKARIGPLQLGVIGNVDMWGLRGGQFGDVAYYETYTRDFLLPWPSDGLFGEERYEYQFVRGLPKRRGKDYIAKSRIPLIGTANQSEYYTQIEVVVAIGGSLRVGFNPGELLDFLLGWTTVDIYEDDIE